VLNVAVTARACVIDTVHAPVPEQAPLQPAKLAPLPAAAVSVTEVPLAKLPLQVLPQLMPPVFDVTVPVPLPAFVTASVKLTPELLNVAVTLRAAVIDTVHAVAVPLHAPPQPPNVDPLAAAAVSVTDTIVQRFFDHIRLFLHSDFTDGDFDLITAVEAFITSILKPRGMLAELVDGILPDGQAPAIVGEIVAAIGSSISEVVAFFQRLRAFLSADFLDPDFNLAGAVEEFIDSVLLPRGRLAELVDGVLPDIQAPALITEVRDAVGGVIGASLADMENRLQHLATGTGLLDATWLDNIDLIPVLPDHRVPGLELTRDNIVGRLFGWLGSGFSHDDESNALGQQTDVVITHTAQVDMLWAALNGLAAEVHEVTLNSYTDNFSRSGSNLGSNWGEHYNTGGFHWECNGSDAVVDRDAFNTDCRNYNVFTLGTSGTDYQTITVNLGSAPTSTIGGHNGGNLACGRMSADGSSRIEFFVRANRAWELAKVIAGSRTVMSSGTLSVVPGAGSLLTLVCGDKAASNPRSYSCKVGTTVVVPMSTFGDSTSNYGSSYRYMGNGGDMDGGPFATGDPGKMNLWIGQDTP
jgi:hypothetical protein